MSLVHLPKTQKGQDTLDNLCAAAEHVFYEKGYHKATIYNDGLFFPQDK